MKKQLLFLSLFTINLLIAQVPSYVPTNGLVGYWPFNGNANDLSGNGNNGIVNGATLTTDRFGNLNSAFRLDNLGNNLLVNNLQPGLSNTSLSVSLWFKFPTQWHQSSLTLVKNGIQYTSGFIIAVDQNDSAYGINNYNVVFIVGNYVATTFISNQTELGSWANIISTYDGNFIKIYFNGILKSSKPCNLNLSSPNGNLVFGSWDNPTSPDIALRQLDDIGFWNRALTQAEITTLYTTLSMEQTPANNQITVYPNPAKEQITIDCGTISNASGWSYQIVNTLGQEVLNGEINSQQNVVSLNSLNGSGVYLVKIYDASNNLLNTQKIILQ